MRSAKVRSCFDARFVARAGFTGTADVYSLGVLVADVALKFLNVPGRVRRSVPEIDRDWENGVTKGGMHLECIWGSAFGLTTSSSEDYLHLNHDLNNVIALITCISALFSWCECTSSALFTLKCRHCLAGLRVTSTFGIAGLLL